MPYCGITRLIEHQRTIPEIQGTLSIADYEVKYVITLEDKATSLPMAKSFTKLYDDGTLGLPILNMPTWREQPDMKFILRFAPQMYESLYTMAGQTDTLVINQFGKMTFAKGDYAKDSEGVYSFYVEIKMEVWENIVGISFPGLLYDYQVEILVGSTIWGRESVQKNTAGWFLDMKRIDYNVSQPLYIRVYIHDLANDLKQITPYSTGQNTNVTYIAQKINTPLPVHFDFRNVLDRLFAAPDVLLASIGILESSAASALVGHFMDEKMGLQGVLGRASAMAGISIAKFTIDLVSALGVADYYGWIKTADYLTQPTKIVELIQEVGAWQTAVAYLASGAAGALSQKWDTALGVGSGVAQGLVGGATTWIFGSALLQILDDFAVECEP